LGEWRERSTTGSERRSNQVEGDQDQKTLATEKQVKGTLLRVKAGTMDRNCPGIARKEQRIFTGEIQNSLGCETHSPQRLLQDRGKTTKPRKKSITKKKPEKARKTAKNSATSRKNWDNEEAYVSPLFPAKGL